VQPLLADHAACGSAGDRHAAQAVGADRRLGGAQDRLGVDIAQWRRLCGCPTGGRRGQQ